MVSYPCRDFLLVVGIFGIEIEPANVLQEFGRSILVEAVVPASPDVSIAEELYDFLSTSHDCGVRSSSRPKARSRRVRSSKQSADWNLARGELMLQMAPRPLAKPLALRFRRLCVADHQIAHTWLQRVRSRKSRR